jgi:hypothetical protein
VFFYYLCPIYFRSKNVLFILKKCTFRFADYIWDIRESKDGEYPIYLVDFSVGVYYAGANFKEFIINLTDKNTYKKILTFRENPLLPKFRPLKMLQ